jgi:hypothetical protein
VRFYAEKCPPWIPALVRQYLDCFTIYLLRDPRDIFLSADAFTRKRNQFGFGKEPGGSDRDFARNLCFTFARCFENYYSDRQRSDVILLRYEDFVEDVDLCARLINERLGTNLRSNAAAQHWDGHGTARTIGQSVRRHLSEPLPDGIAAYLERHLGFEMRELGYSAGSMGPGGHELRFEAGTRSLEHSGHGAIVCREQHADVDLFGNDFWMLLPFEDLDANEVSEIWLCVRGEVGDHCSVYWRKCHESFAEERCIHVPFNGGAHWQIVRFQMRRHPAWLGAVHQLRLDVLNDAREVSGCAQLRWVRIMA